MTPLLNITDRALRYRANRTPPPGPRVCAYCGSDRNVEIEHIDGREENTSQHNLTWACRSCNTTKGAFFSRQGLGRKTHQYNPGQAARTLKQWSEAVASVLGVGNLAPRKAIATLQGTSHSKRSEFATQLARRHNPGEPSYQQYLWAVKEHVRGAHDEGGKVIHATSKARRSEYGSRIAEFKRQQRNPVETAAEAFEGFHGYPPENETEIITTIHEHGVTAGLGELVELVVLAPDRKKVKIRNFGGTLLTCSERRNQLFLDGGDQAVSVEDFGIDSDVLHEKELLGPVLTITYYTVKTHLGRQGGEAQYKHRFGEDGGECPHLVYDTRNKLLEFVGGSYTIPNEGIAN